MRKQYGYLHEFISPINDFSCIILTCKPFVGKEKFNLQEGNPMPIVDMPLEQLKTYKGINPCPKDIDKYWDKAVAEMRAVDPKVELVPAAVPGALARSASTCGSRAWAGRACTPSTCGRKRAQESTRLFAFSTAIRATRATGRTSSVTCRRASPWRRWTRGGRGAYRRMRAACAATRCTATSSAAWTTRRRSFCSAAFFWTRRSLRAS